MAKGATRILRGFNRNGNEVEIKVEVVSDRLVRYKGNLWRVEGGKVWRTATVWKNKQKGQRGERYYELLRFSDSNLGGLVSRCSIFRGR